MKKITITLLLCLSCQVLADTSTVVTHTGTWGYQEQICEEARRYSTERFINQTGTAPAATSGCACRNIRETVCVARGCASADNCSTPS